MKGKKLLSMIFISFVLAIMFGVIFGPAMEAVQPLGTLFLRLINFIIVPLVFTSLIVGVASTGDIKKLGRMSMRTVSYYLGTTAIAITIGLVVGKLMMPGAGLDTPVSEQTIEPQEAPGLVDTLLNIIPTNPLMSLIEANMLQIIFFAIFLGLSITLVGEKAKGVYTFFEGFAEMMYSITNIVMKVAPIGVFGLVAPIVGQYGPAVLLPLLKIIAAVAIAALLHVIITYSSAVKLFAKMSPIHFFKGISPAILVAFSTQSSSGTLPVTIKCSEENLGVSKKVSSFVLPLGATINMDGTALYQGVCVLFVAQLYGIELSFAQLLTIVLTATLASIGTAGVPSAGLVMLTMVMTSVGLPLEGIALIAGIDRILDMIRTSVNVTGDASAATIVSALEVDLQEEREATQSVPSKHLAG
ncbi:dicarboxylate/amino acid:cation symporter [Anaerobacillus alkalidiazotrophicus]|uniref:Dicarboxylate/amino acid:cation symporter n=1 Tax=Anaerobacillus alkalidiazotrophicus TaxID=472963 RepID=A0A1S2LWN0_9BACI|nr:dicarboxylate/amino acid:cation symporter [Anaerobacillus alkalidiazotrophicus]OIJ16929.1 dicarboxylate/amino acid:cation symporter [Anaerobacillus alkalidiazotrophicus]